MAEGRRKKEKRRNVVIVFFLGSSRLRRIWRSLITAKLTSELINRLTKCLGGRQVEALLILEDGLVE
jgi:hypothetical protein